MGFEDLTTPSPQPDTFTGEQKLGLGKDTVESITPDVNFPTFDVELPEIVEAENANLVAQSFLCILEFRLDGELGEGQVV